MITRFACVFGILWGIAGPSHALASLIIDDFGGNTGTIAFSNTNINSGNSGLVLGSGSPNIEGATDIGNARKDISTSSSPSGFNIIFGTNSQGNLSPGPYFVNTSGTGGGTTSLIYDGSTSGSGINTAGGLGGKDLTESGTDSGLLLTGIEATGTVTVSTTIWSGAGQFNTDTFVVPASFTSSNLGTVFIPYVWNFAGVDLTHVQAIEVTVNMSPSSTFGMQEIISGNNPANNVNPSGPLLILTPEPTGCLVWGLLCAPVFVCSLYRRRKLAALNSAA